MVDDISKYLRECSWRGVSFPIQMTGEKGSQGLAIHKKMDRDGAQVEGTGRNPDSFSVKAYFINGLTAGPNESWNRSKALFPNTWIDARDALRDRTSGPFEHPLYGNITCKPSSWSMTINAGERGGVIVDMDFIETIDDAGEQVQQASIFSEAQTAAGNLDTIFGQLVPPPVYDLGGYANNLDEIQAIITLVNTVELKGKQAIGKIERKINSVNKLVNTFSDFPDSFIAVPYDISSTAIKSGVVLRNRNCLVIDALNALLSSLYVIKQELSSQQRPVSLLKVHNRTTLASLIPFTGNSINELLSLNPDLLNSPVVGPNFEVKYYQ